MSIYYNPGHILREWFHCIQLNLLGEWWSHMWWRVYCITYTHDAIFMSTVIILISLVSKLGGGTRWNLQYALFFCSAWKTTYARGPIAAYICTAVHRFSSKMFIKCFKEWHHSVPETTLSAGGPGVYYLCSNKHFRQHTCTIQQACMASIWQYYVHWGYEYTLPAWFEVCVFAWM